MYFHNVWKTARNKIKSDAIKTHKNSIYTLWADVLGDAIWHIITGSIVPSAKRQYLSYSEANFAPMGVKFGVEESTEGRLLHAKFHPIGPTVRV